MIENCPQQLLFDLLTLRYGASWGPWHGGKGGKLHWFEFQDIKIKKVEVYYGQVINGIKFVMTDNTSYGPYGRSSGTCQVASVEQGFLSFIKGSCGALLDRIELYFEGIFYSNY